MRESVTASERHLFETDELVITKTDKAWVVCQLNSFTKTTNSGYAHLSNGQRVLYRYAGDDPRAMLRVFQHDGAVRALAVAYLNDSLTIERIDIFDVQPMQVPPFPVPEDASSK